MEKKRRMIIGWREWLQLPQLDVTRIKAKVDSGARSSSLHAFSVETFSQEGKDWVRFQVHPLQRNDSFMVPCVAELLEMRLIRSSNGEETQRPVIVTDLELGGMRWPIELTLASRDQMGFRMLLGREALRGRTRIDPGRSYVVSEVFGIRPRRFPRE